MGWDWKMMNKKTRTEGERGRIPIHGESNSKGQTASAEYKAWSGMRARCYNPNENGYHNYGGRGIYVCRRWKKFLTFLADMGRKPTSKHTLDRKDNSLPYTPDNCRWATRTEQARNKRYSRKVTVDGVSLLSVEWEERTGIPHSVIRDRVFRLGWDPKIAVTKPVDPVKYRAGKLGRWKKHEMPDSPGLGMEDAEQEDSD